MTKWRNIVGIGVCILAGACQAQTPASAGMTLDEFRHYVEVLHLKDADEKGVRVQMKAQVAQLPPWWPASVTEEMTESMLQVDFAALDYAYVKACVSSPEIAALSAMFATPEGQAYASGVTGGQVKAEANGMSATAAREQVVDHDTGLPLAALNHLTVAERKHIKELLARGAFGCLSSGYQKAAVDISDERTKAVRGVVTKRHDELVAAKTAYEASHPATGK